MLCNNIINKLVLLLILLARVFTAMSRVPMMRQEFISLGQDLERAITCALDNDLLTGDAFLKDNDSWPTLSTPLPHWMEHS